MNNGLNKSLEVGMVLNDKWVILEFIAKGGMGEVYRAHQINLKRDVAVKVISQEWLESCRDSEEELEIGLQRFRNEVQAMAQIRHPNILQIFDYGSITVNVGGEDVSLEYIVMEYVLGGTLRSTMSEEGFGSEEKLINEWLRHYFFPMLDGVQAMHELKMAHRDLKPENVLMDDNMPKIADFGLAHSHQWKPVTQSIEVKGTAAYMSPEHFFEFKQADHRADIYSLGKILYESIDGRINPKTIPFKSTALSNPDTPFLKKLDRIIQDATAEDKKKRLDSVDKLRKNLLEAIESLESEVMTDETAFPRQFPILYQSRFVWAGIVIAIVSVTAMGLWHLIGEPGKTTVHQQVSRIKYPQSSRSGPPRVESASLTSPAQSILGKDGITMLFIPGGKFQASAESSDSQWQTVHIQPFYLDEKKVSNHHFAEFLNEVKDNLIVENGVVKHNDEIWFYLGKVTEPHEQIIYEHGRFHLREIEYAARPVVRVTWYGASAYAQHFGKRLATEYEWDFAALGKDSWNLSDSENITKSPLPKTVDRSNNSGTHMMNMVFPSENLDNLEGMENGVREWVTKARVNTPEQPGPDNKKAVSYLSLVAGRLNHAMDENKSFRFPWEAFTDVGFRCVLNLEDVD